MSTSNTYSGFSLYKNRELVLKTKPNKFINKIEIIQLTKEY